MLLEHRDGGPRNGPVRLGGALGSPRTRAGPLGAVCSPRRDCTKEGVPLLGSMCVYRLFVSIRTSSVVSRTFHLEHCSSGEDELEYDGIPPYSIFGQKSGHIPYYFPRGAIRSPSCRGTSVRHVGVRDLSEARGPAKRALDEKRFTPPNIEARPSASGARRQSYTRGSEVGDRCRPSIKPINQYQSVQVGCTGNHH